MVIIVEVLPPVEPCTGFEPFDPAPRTVRCDSAMRSLSRCLCLLSSLALAAGCADPAPLTVLVGTDHRPLVDAFFEFVPLEGLQVEEADDPAGSVDDGGGLRIALAFDLDCGDCEAGSYRLEGAEGRYTVHAREALGAQYGLAQVLEDLGYRFFHPWKTHVPAELDPASPVQRLGETQVPEMTVRGLHLHTLHPIEAYYDLWEPGPDNLLGAKRLVDWVVKNRGNYIQYPALDDILGDPGKAEAWRAHTRAILDYAHLRGVEVGLGIQLFGQSNLQQAFDLLDEDVPDPRAEMKKRLSVLLDDLPVDEISLSFGEFSAADPQVFLDRVNEAVEVMKALSPDLAINAVIHVGNKPDQRVTWMGEDLLYYFLVKYADPRILPYVHSVMFYNLFEDAGGAYEHDSFSEHRAYLVEKLKAGEPVAYFPESAYWIAFDNSVPVYLPLYLRSRHLDLVQIRKSAKTPLRRHTLFSSGWEWGYWQTDYATLRMGFRLPDRWEAPLEEAFSVYGETGRAVTAVIKAVGEAQHDGLLLQRLAPYLAGRDTLIDAGAVIGIVSQPDRVLFDELHALSEEDRTDFRTNVLAPLAELGDAHQAQLEALQALDLGGDPFLEEVRDGVEITTLRLRYIHALYEAVADHADSGSDGGKVEAAEAVLARARKVASRRHKALHDPDGLKLLRNGPNATVYHYGYLREAGSLCFWDRERVKVRRLLFGSLESEPGCVL